MAKDKPSSKSSKKGSKTSPVKEKPTKSLDAQTDVVDPALTKEVSEFLKELNIGGVQGHDASPQSPPKPSKPSKKKDQPKPRHDDTRKQSTKPEEGKKEKQPQKGAEKQDRKKDKKKGKDTSATQPSNPEPSKPTIEISKPQPLPTKITFDGSRTSFVFPSTSHWHTSLPPLPASSSPLPAITPASLASLSEKAAVLHEKDIRAFQASSSSSSAESSFLTKIIQSGTLSDRLSALTLLIQSSPLHNTKALETLKGMAERGKGKGGREESLKALRCIVDWWVGGGAPDRKLKYFRDQPLTHPSVTDEHLLGWYFEDWLKKYFFSVLQILESLSLDPLPYIRTQTLTLIFTLLRDKAEQEQNLLRLLVNKLGDNEKSVCSRASYHLLQLLQAHPSMKAVVVREMVSLVLRPPAIAAPAASTASGTGQGKHIRFTDDDEKKPRPKNKKAKKKAEEDKKAKGNTHPRYYATITFNQIVLAPGDKDVALQLIEVYFEMFKEVIGDSDGASGGLDDDKGDDEDGEDEVVKDKQGRVVEKKKKKGKEKAETKGAAGFTEVEDESSRLVSAILTGVNRAMPFAKLDAGDRKLSQHIDTLFLITHKSTFNISIQALVLIQQISASLMTNAPSTSSSSAASSLSIQITDRYYRTLYASLHDPRLATSSKQAMYLNLLFKSIKADAGNASESSGRGGKGKESDVKTNDRIKALVRRFVQVLVSGTGGGGQVEFIAGGLYLLGELFSSVPGLRELVNSPPDPSEEEVYDPKKRDPKYAHASASPLWELTPLLHHYHPTVCLHTRQLLLSVPLTGASADLSQNTLSSFLDRFVYKNPKRIKAKDGEETAGGIRGPSAMQPAASGVEGVKLKKGEVGVVVGKGGEEGRVNEEGFLRKRVEDVPVDQLFYYKYFSQKSEKDKAAKKKKGKDDAEDSEAEDDEEEGSEQSEDDEEKEQLSEAEDDEGASELDEDEVWKVMKASMPRAEGDDDLDLMEDSDEDDEDDLPSDFDMSSDDDDGDSQDEGLDASDADSEEEEVEDDEDEDGLSLAEDSGDDDLVSLDEDVPDGLIAWDGDDDESDEAQGEEEEWGGIGNESGAKRKRNEKEGAKERRKKLKSLPTFASYEDYAKMIEDGPEDYI